MKVLSSLTSSMGGSRRWTGPVTAAEIIDGDPDAAVPQLVQDRPRAFHVVQEEVFGDLDGQDPRVQPAIGQRGGDLGGMPRLASDGANRFTATGSPEGRVLPGQRVIRARLSTRSVIAVISPVSSHQRQEVLRRE